MSNEQHSFNECPLGFIVFLKCKNSNNVIVVLYTRKTLRFQETRAVGRLSRRMTERGTEREHVRKREKSSETNNQRRQKIKIKISRPMNDLRKSLINAKVNSILPIGTQASTRRSVRERKRERERNTSEKISHISAQSTTHNTCPYMQCKLRMRTNITILRKYNRA